MKPRTISRLAAGTLLVAALTACGGGDTSAPGPAAAPQDGGAAADAISIALLSPTEVKSVGFGGKPAPSVHLQIGYTGDPQTLNGRYLYIWVQVPDPLYEKQASLAIDLNQSTADLQLTGNLQGLPEGHYTGTMKIYACLDPTCSTQLRNSPLAVPYDVEMKPGLKLSQESLAIESSFGAPPPAPAPVAVSLPFGGTSWVTSGTGSTDISAEPSGDNLLITPSPLALPGTYTSDIHVHAQAPDPQSGVMEWFEKVLMVTYTVSPDSNVPYVLSPTSARYTLTQGNPNGVDGRLPIAVPDGGSKLSSRGVIDFQASPGVTPGPRAGLWLQVSTTDPAKFRLAPCDTDGSNCLPAGTYQATLVYELLGSSGAITDFQFPVTMVIQP